MKKLMIMMSIFLMTGLVSMEAVAQTPNSSRNKAARNTSATAVTRQSNGSTSSQAARQLKRGDAQLNKANSSYQKAQQSASRTPATRPSTTTTSTPPSCCRCRKMGRFCSKSAAWS